MDIFPERVIGTWIYRNLNFKNHNQNVVIQIGNLQLFDLKQWFDLM